jgi:hypothetical protein
MNCVAVSHKGDLLALGLGTYPLNPDNHPCAAIELFSTVDTARPVARRVLPEVAIDRTLFHSVLDILIAVSGGRDQSGRHIRILHQYTSQILDVAEVELFSCLDIAVDCESERVILTYADGLQSRHLEELHRIEWLWLRTESLSCTAYCSERDSIFLSDGRVIEVQGRDVARMTPLEKCSGLAILRNGRIARMNPNGVLRVWRRNSTQVQP